MAVSCWGARGRHEGLEQLSSLAEAGRAFLGPLRASKFVTDTAGEAGALVSSAEQLLESLEARGAVGQLLREAVRAQHAAHGTGAATLLFLAGAWGRAAQDCLQLGIPVPAIVSAMAEGLCMCTEEAAALHLRVRLEQEEGRQGESASPQLTGPGLPRTSPEFHAAPRVAATAESAWPGRRRTELSRSRHLGRGGGRQGEGVDPDPDPPGARACTDLTELAAGLSHGHDGCMALVEAALRLQLRGTRPPPALHAAQLFTCCVPGPPAACSGVCPGFVALVPASCATTVQALERRPARVALLEGDLTHTYRHPGFRAAPGPAGGAGAGGEAAWVEGAERALGQLRVDLILARGRVSEALAGRCLRAGRLALGGVPGRALRALAEASGAAPALYVSQLHEACVGAGVAVALWRGPPGNELGGDRAAVAVSVAAEGAALATAVLTGPAAGPLRMREDAFWRCARRVEAALAEGAVFPGAGAVELLCIARLLALAGEAPGHRPAVFRSLAAGWRRYLTALRLNAGAPALEADAAVQQLVAEAAASARPAAHVLRQHGGGAEPPAPRVYDAVTPKLEAWRRALDLVLLVLQTDSEIVTDRGRPPDADAMLL
ncbi:Bardet-Biedl syndrome 12 protein [Perognathus longimembris pacificus]|uniref:Bardet-Biedl syndrome 12 protein n=1 Tax=Perognathus longimembris pacificus TaxID=214514 RepID=UPI00201856EE|nr:Bardet-Biedl syndrome 12 protein [Perognathus longimembris pacificus]